jgi:Tfp pilus assembly protein PilO
MRIILSILLIAASAAGIALFIVPHYNNVKDLRMQEADYQSVLENARKLEEQRSALEKKYSSFEKGRIDQLGIMLPQNPENVKLILALDAVASQYGMLLQNVKIDDPANTATAPAVARPGTATNTDIGTLTINFSVAGPYGSFTDFIKTIEKSLRIIDIQKISFAPVDTKSPNYQYSVTVKTYWLK